MFGDSEINDLISTINDACDNAETVEGLIEDVFSTVDQARDDADDARDRTSDVVRTMTEIKEKLKALRVKPEPDLYTKLNNIDAAMIQLQVAVDEMRRALKGGGDD